jgi:hypothetical protein
MAFFRIYGDETFIVRQAAIDHFFKPRTPNPHPNFFPKTHKFHFTDLQHISPRFLRARVPKLVPAPGNIQRRRRRRRKVETISLMVCRLGSLTRVMQISAP